jgi:hypothetical protein
MKAAAVSARATAPVAIVAATISDKTCFAICGIEPKPWRALLDELGVPHCKIHRRTVCSVADWLAAIARLSGAPPRSDWSEERMIELASRGRRTR